MSRQGCGVKPAVGVNPPPKVSNLSPRQMRGVRLSFDHHPLSLALFPRYLKNGAKTGFCRAKNDLNFCFFVFVGRDQAGRPT